MKSQPIDRRYCLDDYADVFDKTVEGEPYSDDELREKFRKGLKKLEKRGDFDTIMMYNNSCANRSDVIIVMWKALAASKIHSGNLTGRQLMHLHEILKDEMKK